MEFNRDIRCLIVNFITYLDQYWTHQSQDNANRRFWSGYPNMAGSPMATHIQPMTTARTSSTKMMSWLSVFKSMLSHELICNIVWTISLTTCMSCIFMINWNFISTPRQSSACMLISFKRYRVSKSSEIWSDVIWATNKIWYPSFKDFVFHMTEQTQ